MRAGGSLTRIVAAVLSLMVLSSCGVVVQQRRDAARVELAERVGSTTTLPAASPTIPQANPMIVPGPGGAPPVPAAGQPPVTPTSSEVDLSKLPPVCVSLASLVEAGNAMVEMNEGSYPAEIRSVMRDLFGAFLSLRERVPPGLRADADYLVGLLQNTQVAVEADPTWESLRLGVSLVLIDRGWQVDNLVNSVLVRCPEFGLSRFPPTAQAFARVVSG